MRRFSRPLRNAIASSKKKKKIGLPSGTLIHTGDRVKEKKKIKLNDYTEDDFNFQEFNEIQINLTKIKKSLIKGIDIYGLVLVNIIEEISCQFSLHPLVLEDILSL